MKAPIVFDGTILGDGPVTGVGGSFLTSLEHYAPRAERTCVLLLPEGADEPRFEGIEILPAPRPGPLRRRRLAKTLGQIGAALLHSPVAALPRQCPCPTVATVHDLPWMSPVPLREDGCRMRHRLAVQRAARKASAVIVPSQRTRDDLLRWAGEEASPRLPYIPHGVPQPETPARPEQLCGPFLVLADQRPRKNLERVRRAHELARRHDDDLPSLRIIGPGHEWREEDEKIRALHSCRALLHLTLFDGFGLPVVEAFATGTPVLCSRTGSLDEIAGGAALHADPLDLDDMAAAIGRIHRDMELRETLRRNGLERARAFSVENNAEAWLTIHRRLAG